MPHRLPAELEFGRPRIHSPRPSRQGSAQGSIMSRLMREEPPTPPPARITPPRPASAAAKRKLEPILNQAKIKLERLPSTKKKSPPKNCYCRPTCAVIIMLIWMLMSITPAHQYRNDSVHLQDRHPGIHGTLSYHPGAQHRLLNCRLHGRPLS